MKKIKISYFVLSLLSLTIILPSCNDYEDLPVDKMDISYVFDKTDSLGNQAHGYLAGIYRLMYNGHSRFKVGGLGSQANYLDAATDNAVSATYDNNSAIMRLATGSYSASNPVAEEMTDIYVAAYSVIRKTNVFIANIDAVPLMAKFTNDLGVVRPMNTAWKAEARFLRALFYFELVKRFGGVILMGDRIAELSDDLELPRNSYEDCINYIVSELDVIQDSLRILPLASPDQEGFVATKNAALALKSRVLLYAASPLFNGNSIEYGNELIGYTTVDPESIKERWQRASDAAFEFMTAYGSKELYGGTDIHAIQGMDFLNVFVNDYGGSNKDVIFVREGGRNKDVEKVLGPVGFSIQGALGEGMMCPTQDLVDAFPMRDGRTKEEASTDYPYDDKTMYEDPTRATLRPAKNVMCRDPRLYYSVLHNGAKWLNTTLATYEGGVNNPTGAMKKTKTGYYQRKFMQKEADKVNEYENTLHRWIMFRYAEILLNYAEAENEANGPSEAIFDALRAIRYRAGIEAGRNGQHGMNISMTQDELREFIRNERRLELAFEEHRYWDIRRWRIAEEIYKKPLQGISIIKEGNFYSYNRVNVLKVNFESRMNLYPIPYSEIRKNRHMKQNPGW